MVTGTKSRGRGNRTPVNGFGDRRTTAVLFPYVFMHVESRNGYYSMEHRGMQGVFYAYFLILIFFTLLHFP